MTTTSDFAPTTESGIDPKRFRDLMARVCAPVTIVTTTDGDGPHGATASSFAALSQDPPLITVAFDRRSALLARIVAAGRFGVNLLHHGQEDLAMRFASRGTGGERFTGTSWHTDTGLPRLDDAAGWVTCELYDTVEGGDHLLLIGLVTKACNVERPPLVYANRTFGTHSRFTERPRRPIIDHITACTPD
jgi:flavin reductase (DIM6/NTAB) family NADH-FMN oxidoreductase RutF